jgi:hypothetical protein
MALSQGDPHAWASAREDIERPAFEAAELANASLADFDLSGVDLTNADLSESDFTGATLDNGTFDGADLTRAKLMEVEVEGASFVGASLDEARMAGTFVTCDFTDSTWDQAIVRGCRFVRCKFEGADLDVATLADTNRFDGCTFGERDDVPESLKTSRPEFLRPPILTGERVRVEKLALSFPNEKELRREAIGAATGAGWDAELVAFFKDGTRLYVGLRPEAEEDVLEEWIAFEPGPKGQLAAVEMFIDPGFETFLEEMVVPMFESNTGDLIVFIEQDLEGGGAAVTELVIERGRSKPPKQFKRA